MSFEFEWASPVLSVTDFSLLILVGRNASALWESGSVLPTVIPALTNSDLGDNARTYVLEQP